MPDLVRPDLSLHYEIGGDGPPLLLLAGMLSDSATWAPLLPLLEPHFTVIRPDNRTTGRSTPWDAPVTVAHMVDDAIALLDHLGHDKVHIAGHSMGGLMGMEIAGLHPDKVASLSILASGPVRIPRGLAMFESLLAVRRCGPGGEEAWLRALYPWIFGPAFFETPENVETALGAALAYPHAQSADAMALQIEALRGFRPRSKIGDIACPVQTVFAGEDLIIPNDAARDAFRAIPNLTQSEIATAGHSIVWDAPNEVADKIMHFVQTA
ncbi:alpha/beta fold hydrolase [Aliishimia ponticola]|uniref:Alpha/beta fold hydrolase n=1 Tax=Aliishimia ponticola TaxID=2499833 RepID=A0A4S4N8A1_9RHOB|nr:alpha/beta fold hydrolase [Aliishimia ponticola]THH35426.1 alpha/beta fold hydrolase [Aliishimia ponticola]